MKEKKEEPEIFTIIPKSFLCWCKKPLREKEDPQKTTNPIGGKFWTWIYSQMGDLGYKV